MEDVQMSDLKTIRFENGLTQKEAAERLGVSLRSYVTYGKDRGKTGGRFQCHLDKEPDYSPSTSLGS